MLSKLAGLFVEVEETKSKEEPKEEAQDLAESAPLPNGNGASAPVAPVATSVTPSAVGVNEEMAEMLAAAIEEADLDGFDYLEFRDSLSKMDSIPMPEAQKFQTVFATAQTMDVTVEKLTSAIDHYHGVIEQKKQGFLAHVDEVIATQITSREQKKAENDSKIEEATAEIQRLTQVINDTQQENLTLTNEINTENLNIQNTKASFEATYGVVSGKLLEDKNKIQNYLGQESS